MKITIPVYAKLTCMKEVFCVVLLKGFDPLVVKCNQTAQVWGDGDDKGIYARTLLISFDTANLYHTQCEFGQADMINFKNIDSIVFITPDKEVGKYLNENYYCVKAEDER